MEEDSARRADFCQQLFYCRRIVSNTDANTAQGSSNAQQRSESRGGWGERVNECMCDCDVEAEGVACVVGERIDT